MPRAALHLSLPVQGTDSVAGVLTDDSPLARQLLISYRDTRFRRKEEPHASTSHHFVAGFRWRWRVLHPYPLGAWLWNWCRTGNNLIDSTHRLPPWLGVKTCSGVSSDNDKKRGTGPMARYGKKASEKVERAMHERKEGTLKSGRSGKKVTSRQQAIAIGLSEARREGAKVPRKAA
jgi:hypothetical protein